MLLVPPPPEATPFPDDADATPLPPTPPPPETMAVLCIPCCDNFRLQVEAMANGLISPFVEQVDLRRDHSAQGQQEVMPERAVSDNKRMPP